MLIQHGLSHIFQHLPLFDVQIENAFSVMIPLSSRWVSQRRTSSVRTRSSGSHRAGLASRQSRLCMSVCHSKGVG